jgi:predicted RNA-binding protein with RPS1 domain
LVRISDYIKGFIPNSHTADIPLKDPIQRMPHDTEIKCKIIQLDKFAKNLILTAKKTLVKAKQNEIYAIDANTLKVGMVTYGVVVSIKDYGVLVGFYNDVKALMPRTEIPQIKDQFNIDLKTVFFIGQLVKCRVCDVNFEKKLFKVSLDLVKQVEETKTKKRIESQVQPSVDYKVGHIVERPARVIYKNANKKYLKIRFNTNEYGVLFRHHLSDSCDLNSLLFDKLNPNDEIDFEDVMIIRERDKTLKSNYYILTCKRSIIGSSTLNTPSSVNSIHVAWLQKRLKNGVLCEYYAANADNVLSRFNAYCSFKKLSDSSTLNIGDSCLVRLNDLNEKYNLCTIKFNRDLISKATEQIEHEFKNNCLLSYLHAKDYFMKTFYKNIRFNSKIRVEVTALDNDSNRIDFKHEVSDAEAYNGYGFTNINRNLVDSYGVGAIIDVYLVDFDLHEQKLCAIIDGHSDHYHSSDEADLKAVCKVGQIIKGLSLLSLT